MTQDKNRSSAHTAEIAESTNPDERSYTRAQQELLATLKPEASLADLQDYVQRMVIARGFQNETPQQVMLLITEEVGELAKTLRKSAGIKNDTAKAASNNGSKTAIGDEMADVLLYLLALANACKIDLTTALRHKEEENARRRWA